MTTEERTACLHNWVEHYKEAFHYANFQAMFPPIVPFPDEPVGQTKRNHGTQSQQQSPDRTP